MTYIESSKNYFMKVRILFCALSSIFLLTPLACDDEDKMASVEGIWKGTRAEGEVLVFGVPSGFEEVDGAFDATLEFKQGGLATLTENGAPYTGTWSQYGENLETNLGFTTDFADMSGAYTIQTVTETKLVLYFEKDGTYKDPDTGIDIEGTLKATLSFEKQ
jgi:hypothetical protein